MLLAPKTKELKQDYGNLAFDFWNNYQSSYKICNVTILYILSKGVCEVGCDLWLVSKCI